MKKCNLITNGLSIVAVFISALFAAQTTIIVDNNSTNPVTQNNLQTAITNATAGDIIYVQPSPTSYGDVTIDKAITLVGGSSNEAGFVTQMGTVNLDDGSSNTQLRGLEISSIIQNTNGMSGVTIENVKIKDCKITSSIFMGDYTVGFSICKNWIIEGCNIAGIYGNYNIQNLVIRNNLLNQMLFYDVSNSLISQNIFSNDSYITFHDYGNTGVPLNITNSILMGNTSYTYAQIYIYGKVNMTDCLTYDYGGTGYTITEDGADGYATIFSDMIYNQDPLFVMVNPNYPNDPTENSIANYEFNPNADDLHLQASSPAKGAGAGGEDYGIFHNYNFSNLGNPTGIPKVRITSIPASVPAGNNLQVTITAEAQ